MASLAWIWKQIGVNEDPWRYDGTIPIPVHGKALVMLRDAKGAGLYPDNSNRLTVTEVKPEDVYYELMRYVNRLGVSYWGDVSDPLVHSIEPAIMKELHDGSGKLYSVEGKVVCKTTLSTGTNGDRKRTSPLVDVFTPPKPYKVSFRFLQRRALVNDPNWTPAELIDETTKYVRETPETALGIWTSRNTTEVDA
jgi:hypothetical protein